MAKKAPAKPAPAKRKPRAKKPVEVVVPGGIPNEVVDYNVKQFVLGTLNRKRVNTATGEVELYVLPSVYQPPVVDTTDYGTTVEFPTWLTGGLKAVLLIAVGIAAGIWFAGGIDVSPDNKPEPTPTPVPEPVKSFRVIFVKESGQTLAGEQLAIPGAKEIREYLTAKTTPEGNQPGWREYDPQQQTANEQPTMKALWEAAKPSLLPAPCLVVEVNGKATVMPFPKTVAEAVETLKKAGG